MKRLLIIAFVALFTCKASAQTPVGITKQGLKESEGWIEVTKDSVRYMIKPYKALQFKGENASFVGVVSKVAIIRSGYALLTLGSDKTQSRVYMFTKASSTKAIRYKGKLVGVEGKLEVHNGSPTFRNYGISHGLIYPLRVAYPGCKCFQGEPSPVRRIDTTKS
ncbi:hypothetical protein [Mucilaginibacter sp. PAMB04168]|uniref:hypothetical protein n=1 Tax=Mucilaginibacter sp. PAMB04168 TaxID=3138567 RepID=UPI0031F67906